MSLRITTKNRGLPIMKIVTHSNTSKVIPKGSPLSIMHQHQLGHTLLGFRYPLKDSSISLLQHQPKDSKGNQISQHLPTPKKKEHPPSINHQSHRRRHAPRNIATFQKTTPQEMRKLRVKKKMINVLPLPRA